MRGRLIKTVATAALAAGGAAVAYPVFFRRRCLDWGATSDEASLIMERKMLLGIKRRAERLAGEG